MDWNKLFNDFADKYYAVPDFTNEEHVYALQNYLIEKDMLTEDVDFAIKTLLGEAPTDPKVRDQAKKLGLVSKGYGNWGKEKDGPTTHTNVDGKLEPVGDEKDDDKDKKDKEDDDKPINLSKGGKVDAQLGGDRAAGTMDMMDKDDVGKIEKDDKSKDKKPKHSLKTDKQRNQKLAEVAKLFAKGNTEVRGAGRFQMSQKDAEDYRKWLSTTPEEQKEKINKIKEKQRKKLGGDVTKRDVDETLDILKKKLSPKQFQALMQSLKMKGSPPPDRTRGDVGKQRLRNLIEFYLETGGVSPITDEVVPFHDSQLDHITSLDNGGKDEPDNWMWLEARINQFKGKLTDTEVEARLIERGLMTAEELSLEIKSNEFTNWSNEAEIAYWETKFSNQDSAGLTQEKIDNMGDSDLKNLVKGFNQSLGETKAEQETNPNFIIRYGTRKIKIGDSLLPVSRNGSVKPDKNNNDTWGVTRNDDGTLSPPKYKNDVDGYAKASSEYDSGRESGGAKRNIGELKAEIKKALAGDDNPLGMPIPNKDDTEKIDEAFEAIQGEKIARQTELKRLKDLRKENPNSSDKAVKSINKQLDDEFKQKLSDARMEFGSKSEEYRKVQAERSDLRLKLWQDWEKTVK